ncbi:MAG: glycosyltransferase [Candidatus Omnitrophota bacterium]
MEPLVSVVMTVYNYQDYVGESIQSILSQSFADFEFIIIDDASIDKTSQAVNSFQDKRIRYIRNERNIGQTKSLNKGIGVARGKYIARIDADDIAFPKRLELQVEFLERNPSVGVVGTWLQSVDQNKKLIRKSRYPLMPSLPRLLLLNLFNWPCLTHPTVMIRKDVFAKTGLYNESYFISQDYDLWLRISRHYPVRNIPHIMLNYREHSNSLSRAKRGSTREEVRQIIIANVRFFLPDLGEKEYDSLVRLLMFERQLDPYTGKVAFNFLDILLDSLKNKAVNINSKELIYFKKMARLFYAPRLFLTNPVMALGIMAKALRGGNRGVFSFRFAKSVGHAIFT